MEWIWIAVAVDIDKYGMDTTCNAVNYWGILWRHIIVTCVVLLSLYVPHCLTRDLKCQHANKTHKPRPKQAEKIWKVPQIVGIDSQVLQIFISIFNIMDIHSTIMRSWNGKQWIAQNRRYPWIMIPWNTTLQNTMHDGLWETNNGRESQQQRSS